MGLYGFADIEDAYVAKQMVTERRASPRLRQGTFLAPLPDTSGGAFVAVAITTDIIPARVGDVPGGPIDCVLQPSIGGAAFTDGVTVPVHSWVKTPSADPADEDGGELYIFVAQDLNGMWWFISQDCTDPAAILVEGASTVNTLVGLTVVELDAPGSTNVTIPYEGIYTYNLDLELVITGVDGNQFWDASVGIYSAIDAAFVRVWDFSGSGTPVAPSLYVNRSVAIDITAAEVNDVLTIGCARTTTTGTVTVQAGSNHSIAGPIK